ncbi:unnamed protein product [Parajaminaea phylloscopi]
MDVSSCKDLFGGAIKAVLPAGLIDASDLRQVPDNQEVFLWAKSDVSCIVEVLESVSEETAGSSGLDAAARFHFSSLAHDNDASAATVTAVELPDAEKGTGQEGTPRPVLLTGTQRVRKFNKPDSPLDTVLIHLALWRLQPTKNVDLIMSWNEPLPEAADEAAPAIGDVAIAQAFREGARSLHIQDWGLFP